MTIVKKKYKILSDGELAAAKYVSTFHVFYT
jgi:hypothetical protein